MSGVCRRAGVCRPAQASPRSPRRLLRRWRQSRQPGPRSSFCPTLDARKRYAASGTARARTSTCPRRAIIKVGVLPDTGEAAGATRRHAVLVPEPPELSLDRRATPIEALPVGERVSGVARPLPRQTMGTIPRSRVPSSTGVLSPLVHRARLGAEPASVERVEERGDVQRLVPACRLDAPSERKAGARAEGKVQLVAVEAASLARADGGHMTPGGVRGAMGTASRRPSRYRQSS